MPIKSFKGKIANGAIETIALSTNDGSIGYTIKKFQAISASPAGSSPEAVLKIYKIPQTTADLAIDFSDNTLIGTIFYEGNNNNTTLTEQVIIFDNEIFNQDIYITCSSTDGAMNYYIELEQIKLSLDENTVATLKDIRNIESQ